MKSSHAPSQAALARALGLSPAAITKFKARGMPIDSVQAAQAWRAEHLRPRIKCAGTIPAPASPLHRAEQLGLLALEDFDAHAGELRAALAALSPREARRVRLEVSVWDLLHGPALLGQVCDPSLAGRGDIDDDSEAAGILWDVACGRRVYRGDDGVDR